MKQFLRSGLLVVTGITLAVAGGVFAVNNWNDTSVIADGSIIRAPIIKNNFDYLYERSWDFDGNVLSTQHGVALGDEVTSADLLLDVEGKVGARAYCDEEGNNCITAHDVARDLALPSCDTKTERLGWNDNGWQCVVLNNAPCTTDPYRPRNPSGQRAWTQGSVGHLEIVSTGDSTGEGLYQCVDGSWTTIRESIDRGH